MLPPKQRTTEEIYAEAIKEFKKSLGDSSNFIGVMYDEGKGVQQDYKEAAKWYRLAAEQGDVDAQYNLALVYDQGKGVQQDYKEAVKWFRLAAEQGDVDAQFSLALRVRRGQRRSARL